MVGSVLGCTPEQCGTGVNFFTLVKQAIYPAVVIYFIYLLIIFIKYRKISVKTLIFSPLAIYIMIFILELLLIAIVFKQSIYYDYSALRPQKTFVTEYKEISTPTLVDISDVDKTKYKQVTAFNIVKFQAPSQLYAQFSETEPNTITYGLGIKNDFTIRYGNGDQFKQQRISSILAKQSVTKVEVVVNGKRFETYFASPRFIEDSGTAGFRDWYIQSGEDVLVFSEPASSVEKVDPAFAYIVNTVEFIK